MGRLKKTKAQLPYVHIRKNSYGTLYPQFRKKGMKSVPLPLPIGGSAFLKVYAECMSAVDAGNTLKNGPSGSIAELIAKFKNSTLFASLSVKSSKKTYTRILDRFIEEHGQKPAHLLQRHHIERIIADKASTPAAANQLLKRLRQVLQFGVDMGLLQSNAAIGVKYIKYKKSPIRTWTEAEVIQYSAVHLFGSTAHVAFMIALHTGLRLSDIVLLGRQHIRLLQVGDEMQKFIVIQQEKTEEFVEIPVHSDLAPVLALVEAQETFILTSHERPFSAKGFGQKMREWCDQANLPQCTSHGLRKLTATRLAEAECNENTISSILGWRNNEQAALYTRAANRRKLALNGMRALT